MFTFGLGCILNSTGGALLWLPPDLPLPEDFGVFALTVVGVFPLSFLPAAELLFSPPRLLLRWRELSRRCRRLRCSFSVGELPERPPRLFDRLRERELRFDNRLLPDWLSVASCACDSLPP